MRIAVYGGGAVGLGVGSCLLKSGAAVDFIARKDTVGALKKDGLKRTGIFGSYVAGAERFGAACSIDKPGEVNYDYILVCTKSFDSRAAAEDLYRHQSIIGDAKIVLFQNGWGNAEKFAEFFDRSRIYNARVITGFYRPRKNEVVITVHADAIHMGSLFGGQLSAMEPLAKLLDKGGIPCEVTGHIEKDLWAKMLYNCALNPLGAILDVPYGRLAEYEYTRKIMDSIIDEAFAVMVSAGFGTHQQNSEGFRKIFYEKLVPDTAEHKSSTLQDIKAGKSTEIDALNGAVIELAAQHGVETPCNRTVYNIIKFIEARNVAGKI